MPMPSSANYFSAVAESRMSKRTYLDSFFLYPTEENARSEIERPINAAKKAIKVFPIEWEE